MGKESSKESREDETTSARAESARSGRGRRHGADDGTDIGNSKFAAMLDNVRSRSGRSVSVYAILCFVACACTAAFFFLMPFRSNAPVDPSNAHVGIVTMVLSVALCAFLALTFAFLLMMGLRLLKRDYRNANWFCDALLTFVLGAVLCNLCLYGINTDLIILGAVLVFCIALDTYLDPSLAVERALGRQMHGHGRGEKTRAKLRSVLKKGYIDLNFFNLFWIFVIASVLGLIVETIFHLAVFHAYQDRAGLLWGPFSPIYGFGAILMTIALNRMHDKNIILIFLVSAVVGGAFEYFVSWYLQFCFGVVAWNYTGMWLSIGGRTCGLFMGFWGLLGVTWIKILLPLMKKVIDLIPWSWRYAVTTVCAILLVFDGVMTLVTMDCWYKREAGLPVVTPIEQYCAKDFDDAYMQNRFQTMTMTPSDAMRVEK